MKDLAISIIMPAYNVEAFVDESIQSVLNQTVPAHELIIVNDGSTDATASIIERYAKETHVRLIHQKNQGLGSARNTGASLATGNYIHFLDSDDLIDQRFIETMQAQITQSQTPPDMVFFSGEPFLRENQNIHVVINKNYYRRPFRIFGESGEKTILALCKNGLICASASLYITRRKHWLSSHASFPAIIYEDEGIIIDLLMKARHVNVIDEIILCRRLRAQSLTTQKKSLQHLYGRYHNLCQSIAQFKYARTAHPKLIKILRKRVGIFGIEYYRMAKELHSPLQKKTMLYSILISRNWYLARKFTKIIKIKF